ncbi:MAG: NifU family protein [Bacteroidales bacterium]|jgi:Fe-S cluster biogenesis protein NfuA|nr:NifU family protein [Bacteroidales bacterium]
MEKIFEQVNLIIEEIKPFLQADGGDISLIEITDDFVVKVKLLGACGSCPHSLQTLKLGVESKLKNEIPQIKEVVAV